MREEAVRLRETTDYALAGTGVVGMGIFEQGCFTVGSEEFMIAMAADRPLAERLLDGITEYSIESATRYLDQVGEFLDVYQYGDDVATQLGWMISPEAYVSLIKPRQKRLFDAIRAKTSAKLFYHGCGAVFDLIPHLIDIGVDVINPVQVSAQGMDTARLKATYGRDVVFWGGGVDTQKVLPFGTPDEVRAEVRRRIGDLGPEGFVWAAVHNIQSGVPPENVVAAFEAVRAAGGVATGRQAEGRGECRHAHRGAAGCQRARDPPAVPRVSPPALPPSPDRPPAPPRSLPGAARAPARGRSAPPRRPSGRAAGPGSPRRA